jgi:hypothetical protein
MIFFAITPLSFADYFRHDAAAMMPRHFVISPLSAAFAFRR